jgi:hypothetical protein
VYRLGNTVVDVLGAIGYATNMSQQAIDELKLTPDLVRL